MFVKGKMTEPNSQKKLPMNVPKLVTAEASGVLSKGSKREIADRRLEATRVLKRLLAIVAEHRRASLGLGVVLGGREIRVVTVALRDHAKGGSGALQLEGCDEILAHCLTRLYEELVEEPSNIFYSTVTGPDTIRYDAMDSQFWVECLDLLENTDIAKMTK